MADDIKLDQLWYTWSTNGLGSMAMGFRVRAASEGLYDTQSLRYRRIDRFLRYEAPRGVSPNGFEPRIAPITLAFIHNGEERLLVRKVFTGLDATRRNASSFTHLIAGLPERFTARDAIRLWVCPKLWVDSEQDKAYNDTHLPRIPYHELEEYVRQSQTQFNFAPISEQLTSILQVILSQGVPSRISLRGQSIFVAALIYGITHCLPMTLLKDLTFTTYESEIDKFEATILGTLSAEDMAGGVTLQINPAAPNTPVSRDIQNYVSTVVDCLLENNTTKLNRMLEMAEKSGYATGDLLISLYKLRFRSAPLAIEQLESIVYYPDASIDELLDPATPREAVDLLLHEEDYWKRRGKQFFSQVVSQQSVLGRPASSQEAREALTAFFQNMETRVLAFLEKEISQGTLSSHSADVLLTVAPPDRNAELWRNMLVELPTKPLMEARFISEALWPFREWMITIAAQLQPAPTLEQMRPWLLAGSWEKSGRLLRLEVPTSWKRTTIVGLLRQNDRGLPRFAFPIIQTHESLFRETLQQLLQRGYQENQAAFTDTAVHFFTGLVERESQDRMAELTDPANAARSLLLQFLIFLLNVTPKDPMVIERLFAALPVASPSQLTGVEMDRVLTACSPEVIAACDQSPALLAYIREWLLTLTPNRITDENSQKLLELLSKQPPLSKEMKKMVFDWTAIIALQQMGEIKRDTLENASRAVLCLLAKQQAQRQTPLQGEQTDEQKTQEAIEQRQQFVVELVPALVEQVKTEPELELVLEIIGDGLLNSRWGLLSSMASLVGRRHAQDLSRLTSYLLRGIHEHVRLHDPQNSLDEYLQTLYSRVGEQGLREIDLVVEHTALFPQAVRSAWYDWRTHMKASKQGEAVQGTNKPFWPRIQQPGQQASPTDSPSSDSSKTDDVVILPRRSSRQKFPTQPRSDVAQSEKQQASEPVLPAVPYTAKQPRVVLPDASNAKPGQQPKFVATIEDLGITIRFEYYQWILQRILPVLKYWSLACAAKRDQSGSKSIRFELTTLEALSKELQKPEASNVLMRRLVEYLVDDRLIEHEMTRLVQEGVPNHWFDVDRQSNGRSINDRLSEMKAAVGPTLTQSTDDLRGILHIFMRRDFFIEYLDQQRGIEVRRSKMESWLEDRRKKAKIHIGYS